MAMQHATSDGGGPRHVDVHAHYVSHRVLAEVDRHPEKYGVTTQTGQDGQPRLVIGGAVAPGPVFPRLRDLSERQDAMRELDVQCQMISVWLDIVGYALPAEQGAAWSRLLNESVSQDLQEAGQPACYRPLATLPLQDGRLAAAELEHAVTRLGMRGAAIATNIAGRNLDDPALEPLWSTAEQLEAPVLIHPANVTCADRLKRFFLANALGNPFETTVAAAHLLFSGVPDRHPDLKVILVHGGGYFPYQVGRLQYAFEIKPDTKAGGCKLPPMDAVKWFYYDTVMFYPQSIRYLADTVGVDRVLMGSDYPFELSVANPVGFVVSAGLDGADTAKIAGENCSGVFQL